MVMVIISILELSQIIIALILIISILELSEIIIALILIISIFFFLKVFGGHMSFFGATGTPVLDFW